MSWGISDNAREIEKIFADFSDAIGGMNSCGEISYSTYSEIWDMARSLTDRAYEQGKKDAIDDTGENADEQDIHA